MTTTPIPPVHQGEVLADILDELEISQSQLARALGVPRSRINQIVLGRRSIEADTALRLARFFGTSDRYWLNLQARYDLEVTRDALGDALAKVRPESWCLSGLMLGRSTLLRGADGASAQVSALFLVLPTGFEPAPPA